MTGGVEDDEAARALKGWIARGAVVCGGRDVRIGQQSLDRQRGGGGMGGGNGATLSLAERQSVRTSETSKMSCEGSLLPKP